MRSVWGGCDGGEGRWATGKPCGQAERPLGLSWEATSYQPRTVRTAPAKTELKNPTAKWTRTENQVPEVPPARPFREEDITGRAKYSPQKLRPRDDSRKKDENLVQQLGKHCMLHPLLKGAKTL